MKDKQVKVAKALYKKKSEPDTVAEMGEAGFLRGQRKASQIARPGEFLIVQRQPMKGGKSSSKARRSLASGSREKAVRSKIQVLAGKASAFQNELASQHGHTSRHLESKSKGGFKGLPFETEEGRKTVGGYLSPARPVPFGHGTEGPPRSSTALTQQHQSMGLPRQRSRQSGKPGLLHAQSMSNIQSQAGAIPRLPLEGLQTGLGPADNSQGLADGDGASDFNYTQTTREQGIQRRPGKAPLSARSSVTRSIRSIMQRQAPGMLIQASTLMHSAVKQQVVPPLGLQRSSSGLGLQSWRTKDQIGTNNGFEAEAQAPLTARVPQKKVGGASRNAMQGANQMRNYTEREIGSANSQVAPGQEATGSPKQSAAVSVGTFKRTGGRFVDRVRQNAADQALESVVVDGSISARSAAAGHSYRAAISKNAGKIVRDAGVAGTAKVPKVPEIVVKQQSMIKLSDRKSPFLTEYIDGGREGQVLHENGLQTNGPLGLENPSRRGMFLALELFDPYPDQDLETVTVRLRDPEDGKCYARSKWSFHTGKEPELRRCEVLEFLPDSELFLIRWLHHSQCKKVSRFNLIFEREDQAALDRRVQEANRIRAVGELLMRYHYMVDNTRVSSSGPVPDHVKTRISYRVLSYRPFQRLELTMSQREAGQTSVRSTPLGVMVPKRWIEPLPVPEKVVQLIHADFKRHDLSFVTLSALFEELDVKYEGCARLACFEAGLPYSDEYFQLFQGILPKEKFLPPAERGGHGAPLRGLVTIEERVQPFNQLLNRMAKRLHLATASKFAIMTNANKRMVQLAQEELFRLKFKYPVSTEEFVRAGQRQSLVLIGQVRDHMLDAQYELAALIAKEATRVNDINEQRRRAASHKSEVWQEEVVAPAFYADMRELSVVLNMQYETGLRGCFERSTSVMLAHLDTAHQLVQTSCGKSLLEEATLISGADIATLSHDAVLDWRVKKQLFQLEMTLIFSKSKDAVELWPTQTSLTTALLGLIEEVAKSLTALPCLNTPETGYARKSEPKGRSKVFPDCLSDMVPQAIADIKTRLTALLRLPSAVEAQLAHHAKILGQDTKKYAQALKAGDFGVSHFAAELLRLSKAKEHVEQLLFEEPLRLGPIVLHCQSFKDQLVAKIDDLNSVLFTRVKRSMTKTSKEIEVEVQNSLAVLNNERIRDIEELCEIKDFVQRLPEARQRIKGVTMDVNAQINLLEQYQCRRPEDEVRKFFVLSFSEPLKIAEAETDCRERLEVAEAEFLVQLRQRNEQLAREIDECKLDFEILQGHEALQEHDTAANRCALLEEKLERCDEVAELSNSRELLFGVRQTDYTDINKLKDQFLPYHDLWHLARRYFDKINVWMKGPLCDIDRDQITEEVTDACQRLLRLEKVEFKELRAIAHVAAELRDRYEGFRPYLPLICALRSPHLKTRHWESIVALTAPSLRIDSDLHQSLAELRDEQVMQWADDINEISHFAGRERKLEEQIQAMKDEWRNIRFDLVPFKDTDTHLLHKPEPIWDLLDEHILKTMAIASSPYVKFLRSEVNYWKSTLIRVQEVLEEWGKVQRGWLYLQPIFTSPDIQAQLPLVTGSFMGVDKIWRSTMSSTLLSPLVLEACFQSRLMESFQSCNETLDRVQKGLCDYLTQKRLAFPRFFFLPNDDLLQILSHAKEPARVQPYLHKIFEGINRITIAEEPAEVQGMSSRLGEHVTFSSSVPLLGMPEPHDGDEDAEMTEQLRPVEQWLLDVETAMRMSLRAQAAGALEGQETQNRSEWLFKWPAQIVLALDQCRWTAMVENQGLRGQKDDPTALKKALELEEATLRELVALTRSKPEGDEEDQYRHAETLGALIVLGVHAKDVTAELLSSGVSDPEEFEWIAQLRNYVVYDVSGKGTTPQLELEAKMVTATRRFGFEYLGNQPRLVITPLTDRCFRTLMVALQLCLGGAPEGPAGTGKTETTKDLAKALAKQCLVFNCSEQLDVETMGKFFRGLACCGAWACFDEFNRIEVEVLSVVASQILQIQTALMRKRPRAAFTFEGDTLLLDPTCAVFITMNPGYAGRSELPDNLKTLFRPVAMMVPNYAMIAEISLYSFGFQKARELSMKITLSLRLASEQLSSQSHYDYGMRAVKSIIQAAGRRKAESPTEDEVYLACRAISESSVPKFVAEDVPLFLAILSDLFPDIANRVPDHSKLRNALKEAAEGRKLELAKEFEEKAIQLHQTFQVRHGLMLVGATMSGKTELLWTLAGALQHLSPEESVNIHSINPKAVTIGQLYGDVDPLTHEWSDGVLARVVRESASDESQATHWITLDGPVDAVWVENLNTVLDDNKKLCLPSGEIIKFHSRMAMVFEVADLLEASPATVSRCGMVYLTPEKLGWQVQTKPWIQALPPSLRAQWRGGLLASLIESLVPPTLEWLFETEGLDRLAHPGVSANWLVRSFLNLLEAMLLKGHTRATLAEKEQGERDKQEAKEAAQRLGAQNFGQARGGVAAATLAALQRGPDNKGKKHEMTEVVNLFLMAAAWGFGALLNSSESQRELSDLLTHLASEQHELKELMTDGYALAPPGMSLHDHYLDLTTGAWSKWSDRLLQRTNGAAEGQSIENQLQDEGDDVLHSDSVLIPTEDTLRFTYLIDQLTRRSMPVCLLGGTGSGKSSVVKEYLSNLKQEEWEMGQLVLSATTSATSVQEFLESKLEKQRKGVFGPRVQGKRVLIFLDDMGMPAREKYGAQPPLELIRTLMVDGSLFDLKDTSLKKVVGTVMMAAMGLPGGGRTLPTNRLLRHFCLVNMPELSNQTMLHVFGKIFAHGLQRHNSIWRKEADTITRFSVALYQRVRKALLPTPAKCHYQFNVRQLAELMHGMLMVEAATVETSTNKQALLHKLWVHESRRVFTDRLVCEADELVVEGLLQAVIPDNPGDFVNLGLPEMAPSGLLFCNFAQARSADYTLVQSSTSVKNALSNIITVYNQAHSKAQLTGLQLFTYMIEHLGRISRIVKKPKGHGLLVSLGGNGRTTLIKLAAFINDCTLFKIEFTKNYGRTEWLDDMKAMFKQAGVDDRPIVFALTATEAGTCAGSIEDVSSITNSGEVPNLFSQDDIEEIRAEVAKQSKQAAGVDLLQLFSQRSQNNVHVLLSMSPAGDDLREHLRRYPALGHCTTIDWFLPWPAEALQSVAVAQLRESPFLAAQLSITKQVEQQVSLDANRVSSNSTDRKNGEVTHEAVEDEKNARASSSPDDQHVASVKHEQKTIIHVLAALFVGIFQTVVEAAQQYQEELGRVVYLTPARFGEGLLLFERLITEKSARIQHERDQYSTGVRKLDEAKQTIDRLEEELGKLGPELEEKGKAVEVALVKMDKEVKEVEETQQEMAAEALIVAEQKSAAEAIKEECELRLQEAQPLYDAALRALRTLKVNDFVTMKSFIQPPQPIRLALEAACIMLGQKPKMVDKVVGKAGQKAKVPDYWDKSKKLLNDYKKFLNSLEKYDKDSIPPERIAAIQSYLADPEFVPEKIRKASEAAEGICKWVIAVCKYDVIAKEVRPRRAALSEAQAKLQVTEAEFMAKQEALAKVVAHRDALVAEHARSGTERQSLLTQRDQCAVKLQRASQLMASLGSEKTNWLTSVRTLNEEQAALLGDMVLASCVITYLGPFEASYRQRLVTGSWRELIAQTSSIPASPHFDLRDAIGDVERMQRWQLCGIPNDSVSTENMILLEVTEAERWPLLIDPQEQALAFMREYLEHDYILIKASSEHISRTMEHALGRGAAVIYENVGELEGPAALLSLLGREVYHIAGGRYIKFDDNQVEYHDDFRLLMFTGHSNPRFSPAIQSKVQLLNFSITQEGLQAQLLSLVCKSECQKEEDEKHRLHRQDLEFRRQKSEIEREILKLLREAGDDVLEDDTLLHSLDESKRITDDISHKLLSAKHLGDRIEASRKAFRPVAVHGARLFFAIQSLSSLDPMYQFSMRWFSELFIESMVLMVDEARERDAGLRGIQLKQRFRALLFESVSVSIFGHHQLAFAFLIAVKVHEQVRGALADDEEAEAFRQQLQLLEQASGGGAGQPKAMSTASKFLGSRKAGPVSTSKRSETNSHDNNTDRGKSTRARQPQLAQHKKDEERLAVETEQLSYLLTGLLPAGSEVEDAPLPPSCKDFLDDRCWRRVLELATFDCFENLPEEIESQPEEWRSFIHKQTQSDGLQAAPVPEPFADRQLPEFSAILLLRVLKPELAVAGVSRYIERALGPAFISPAPSILKRIYDDRSKPTAPILLLLTPGNDPMEGILRLAEDKQRIPHQISLGKGQAAKARSTIAEMRQYGGWVVLQNCHLAPSFMPELAQIVDQLQPLVKTIYSGTEKGADGAAEKRPKAPHPEFRLWLTSNSCDTFPGSILQSSIKLTSEPPKGIRSSLARTLRQVLSSKPDKELFESSTKPERWRPLFLSLAFFHAIVRERRKFGALGWNSRYDFNDSDFRVSMRQLHLMLETFESLPLKALRYLTGECNYGGRVTDDLDRRTLTTLLEDFFCEEAIDKSKGIGYNFSGADHPDTQKFSVVQRAGLEDLLEYVSGLPVEESPLLVGLHPNATINLALIEADAVLEQVLRATRSSSTSPGRVGAGDPNAAKSQQRMIQGLQEKVRAQFDVTAVRAKFPFAYTKSMNVVLVQEVARYNTLLEVVHASLEALILALQGLVVTTAETEATLSSLLSNQVPARWQQRAYPSLKPLSAWIEDLQARTKLLDDWIAAKALPNVLWISGLFFPQSFLTAAKQDYARKYGYPVDKVELEAELTQTSATGAAEQRSATSSSQPGSQESEKQDQSGHRVSGLFLEGSCWSEKLQHLEEPAAGAREQALPSVLLRPHLAAGWPRHASDAAWTSLYKKALEQYACPVYRTTERRGTLSTTGHSTNFVMSIPLPTAQPPRLWVKRGAAIVLATAE